MPESVYFFWFLVGFLALAAACNHTWHHARDSHHARLARASRRETPGSLFAGDVALTIDIEDSAGV